MAFQLSQPLIYHNLLGIYRGTHMSEKNDNEIAFGWEPGCIYLYTTVEKFLIAQNSFSTFHGTALQVSFKWPRSINLGLDSSSVELGFKYIRISCMNFEQFQPPIWHTLDHKTTQIWWLVNMDYKHSKLWLFCCCFRFCCWMFCPHSCTYIPYYFWTSGFIKYT